MKDEPQRTGEDDQQGPFFKGHRVLF
jgi:hypothetical protein